MPLKGRNICKKIKKNGLRCGAVALKGSDYCRRHGGKMARDSYKHGLYARYQPAELSAVIEEQRANPNLMDLREQVAMTSGALAYTFQKIKERIAKAKVADKNLTTEEINNIVFLSGRVGDQIERTARVAMSVKMMVHVDLLDVLMGLWVDVAEDFLSVKKLEEFRKKLSLVTAQQLKTDKTAYDPIGFAEQAAALEIEAGARRSQSE